MDDPILEIVEVSPWREWSVNGPTMHPQIGRSALGTAMTRKESAVEASVGVVVPTYNSERTIGACLVSLREQSLRPLIVVVDNQSSDGTSKIARRLADVFMQAGPERSAQRNRGAESLPAATVLGFIDSDMILGADVVFEAVEKIISGAVAAVVPETTVGVGYWAKVRFYERSLYRGCSSVEAARFFDAHTFRHVGGFDESLTGPEDWVLTEEAARFGPIATIGAMIKHDEGRLRYLDACRKKGYYAAGLRDYAKRRGLHQVIADIAARPWLRSPGKLISSPYGPGLLALKSGEVVAVGIALVADALGGRP